jgi:phosphoadenosine phosphosulfate reductase
VRLDAYMAEHSLPAHPLVEQGYPSIGCSPCTTMVTPGEDTRSGRWKGWDKVECGIHTEAMPLDDNGANDPIF